MNIQTNVEHVITPSQEIDLKEIMQLYQAAITYQKEKGAVHWPEFEENSVLQEIREGKHYKIENLGSIICIFSIVYDEPVIWGDTEGAEAVYLHRMAAHPEYRGNSLFRKIKEWMIAHAQAGSRPFARLDTWAGSASLINYYQQSGFTKVDERIVPPSPSLQAHYWNQRIALFELSVEQGNYYIKTGRENMDLETIHQFLSNESYWSPGISKKNVQMALANSFCIGVFAGAEQVAFMRLITDYTSFGYLADVFVIETHRKKGLSKLMLNYLMNLEWVKNLRRMMLATKDAHKLYTQYQFGPADHHLVMEKVQPKLLQEVH
ncbi:GNAT family N-acetyltransferase [Rapidithrix thailandica]|uniref:GNAT family N-acetyltransferase n=1 Tax=Rapidithrix thailandica TaxID=413964 RepID=A0AAW9S5C0_9BACT